MRVRLALHQGPIVIGIAGVTRSGKSTLASSLAKQLGVSENLIVHQDKSWKPPRDRPWSSRFNKPNMECPDSVDWGRLRGWVRERVEQAKSRHLKYVIVEGFLLFSDAEMRDMCHAKIFVTIPKREAFERRTRTKFVRKDEFDELIWPSFVRYNA
jgi:uridine kinase